MHSNALRMSNFLIHPSSSGRAAGLLVISLLLAGEAAARAGLMPVAQDRRVFISGQATDNGSGMTDWDSHAVSAPDFSLFDEMHGVAINVGVATADGLVSQRSAIGPAEVTVTSLADAFATAFDPDPSDDLDVNADAGGSSNFWLTFDLDSAETWRLEADGYAFDNGGALVQLMHGADILASWDPASSGSPLDETLLLPPGRYDLLADVYASGFAAFGNQTAGRAELGLSFRQVGPAFVVPELGTWLGGAVLLGWLMRPARRPRAGSKRSGDLR